MKSRTEKEAHLQRFWPQGKERPFVFCNVVGREAETHTGQKGTARVGLESKYNKEEAMKIVRTSLNCVVCLYTQQNNHGSQIARLPTSSVSRHELGLDSHSNTQTAGQCHHTKSGFENDAAGP